MINTLCVFGTRPEAIKIAPIIKELQNHSTIFNKVCVTSQHQQMLESVLNLFQIKPDYNLKVMAPHQDLTGLTVKILTGLAEVFKEYKPDVLLVHGDTTTTFAASLSAYYHRIPIVHIEAGLRTWDINSPWPEEANRKLVSTLAVAHFAPTQSALNNLVKEAVPAEKIYVTGNTVIDALNEMVNKIDSDPILYNQLNKIFPFLKSDRKFLLVTGHRRENFGQGFNRICRALTQIAILYPDVDIVYPIHLNPQVQVPVKSLLGTINNIHLIEPVDYLPFVYLMKSAYIILTDSGGIQEEAPTLGKPVLVMRDITERPEAVDAGTVKLVGTHIGTIVSNVTRLLNDDKLHKQMSCASNPYGDGKASMRIVQTILQLFTLTTDALSINLNFSEEEYAK